MTDTNCLFGHVPIVVVDDEECALMAVAMTLQCAGYKNVVTFTKGTEALAWISKNNCGAVVLDIMMEDMSGTEILARIKSAHPEIVVIMVTGVTETDVAVKCMKDGAYDYILKPVNADRFIMSIEKALEVGMIRNDYERLTERMLSDNLKNPAKFESVKTQNQRLFNAFKYIEAVAPSKQPLLITGETGTGKELIAKIIHSCSGLDGEFVAVNVAGLDDNMFSDVLFGHGRGAFTGAESQRAGLINAASGGTLFLDEIGDLSIQSQVKLLRLIQQREYFPLGSDTPQYCNARIISATSKPLSSLEDSQQMRKDLFYRLRTHHINLPPLRERKEDLELLVNSFVEKSARELNKPIPHIPKELFTLLNVWHFPGNIRELEGMVHDAMCVHQKGILSLNVFRERLNISDNVVSKTDNNNCKSDKNVIFNGQLPTLKEIEDLVILEAIDRSMGNQSVAADLLGITRQSLSYRLKRNSDN